MRCSNWLGSLGEGERQTLTYAGLLIEGGATDEHLVDYPACRPGDAQRLRAAITSDRRPARPPR
jgi:hypothetical protein